MRSRQSCYQRVDLEIIHVSHHRPLSVLVVTGSRAPLDRDVSDRIRKLSLGIGATERAHDRDPWGNRDGQLHRTTCLANSELFSRNLVAS
jgi:hypothetical protein